MGTEDTGSSEVRARRPVANGGRGLRGLALLGVVALTLAAWSRHPMYPKLAFSADRGEQIVAPAGIRSRAIADLRSKLTREIARIQSVAEAALDAPPSQSGAFEGIPVPRAGDPAWGVMLFERGHRLSWSGRLRVAAEDITAPLSVTSDRFFTTVNAVAARGDRLAVASFVLHAEPPGDRLSPALDEQVVARHPLTAFTYAFDDSSSGGGEVLLRDLSGNALVTVQAIPASPGEVSLEAASHARTRIAVILALLLVSLLGIAFHSRSIVHRALALAVCGACIAIVPLNSFSNAARWFNPSYYYSDTGGRWTASAAALTLTGALLFLAVYAAMRARLRFRSQLASGAGGMLAAAGGVYLLDALASGIGQPPRGSTISLWLMWELPLFLVCFSLLLLGAWLATGIRPRRRALVGSHALAVAVLAGVLAAVAVWRTTTQQRMTLAEADVALLKTGDEYAAALLDRLREQLSAGRPPVSRADLLHRYVGSELAIAGYPLSLRSWDSQGRPLASFDAARVAQDTTAIARAVAEALATGESLVRRVLSGAGAQDLLVAPHSSGATSVAVLPRTRLIAPDPFGPLLGLPPALSETAPYVLYLGDRAATGSALSGGIAWRRMGNELHADDAIETVSGVARVHLEVDTRSSWALFQRLVLVVLLDILVASALWMLAAAAEGGAFTRARVRLRHWGRSYRARLTLALFVFFLAPALAFSLWSYRRLRSDFRQTRQLVVRETLNAAIAAGAERNVELVGARFGLPLFLYREGQLSETSDPLYWELSPVGRALQPSVFQALEIGDEITANSETSIGGSSMLFGYRASVGLSGERFVIAAPARGDDEALARRRNDLGVLLLFSTALGALAALVLSGIAARQFAAPIDALRRSVRAIARGEEQLPLPVKPPTEFSQAFTAVRRMADDLDASRRELARAERVLAWGEMARQVAHEIKNPLTPMRLGVQHLQRARHDPRVDFDAVFDANMRRILEEIDRLDNIARAFSRYGSAQPDLPGAEEVDVSAIVSDVIELERMAGADVQWDVAGAGEPAVALAGRTELREVLLNVLENARHAGARHVSVRVAEGAGQVTIEVIDDGSGISPAAMPRVFEPHFSTRTTGSGLGLAISRRLVEAWGGTIDIQSGEAGGTTVRIALLVQGDEASR